MEHVKIKFYFEKKRRLRMNIILTWFKEGIKVYYTYIKENLWEELKAALLKALASFKDTLWKEMKDTVQEHLLRALQAAEVYYNAEQVKVKEKELVSQVIDTLKLPLVVRPFKGLMKSYLTKKVEELIQEAIKAGYGFLE